MPRLTLFGVLLVGLWACGDDGGGATPDAMSGDAPIVDAAAPDADPLDPQSLRDTGLYADFDGRVLADGVVAYEPSHPLWSDEASKRRWILLPAGSQIDTSNMDYWVYPEGTKLWKEFTRDDVVVETRLLWKQPGGDWFEVAYVWNEAGTDAIAMPTGAENALGTDHDVPSRSQCRKCHGRMVDNVLGFTAMQLDRAGDGVTLASLAGDGLLSDPPVGSEAPYYPLPGDATAQAALGYLDANCGGCHNDQSDVMDTVQVELKLMTASLASVEETRAYLSTVCQPQSRSVQNATAIIEPSVPATSAVHIRMMARGQTAQMPPEGTELVDPTGLGAVDAWIASMTPGCD